jgi:acyl-CoA thioesterase
MKAGILEIADIFVVTKADLPEAQRAEADLNVMIELRDGANRGERQTVMKVSTRSGEGVVALVNWLERRTQRGLRHKANGSNEAYRLVTRCLAVDNVARALGMELLYAAPGQVTLRMHVQRSHMNFNKRCHGGMIFALSDMALGLASNTYGLIASLVSSQISISTAVEEGEWLIAKATEVDRSRKIGNYQTLVMRARDGAHVALMNGTVYILDRPVMVEDSPD